MSRAYRIAVRESAWHVLRAGDHVSSRLEVLEVLPPERMAGLLAQELQRRGFRQKGAKWVRAEGELTVEVEPATATVTVRVEAEQEVELQGERQTWGDQAWSKAEKERAAERVREDLLMDLQRKADQRKTELQKKLTDKLEGCLGDVRKELDQVVNRVTAEALKEKAAQLGQIKELTEDEQTGSLTIVIEV
jgi:DNA anti-recombination protein RmuC